MDKLIPADPNPRLHDAPTPTAIRGYVLRALQAKYCAAENVHNPLLRTCIWDKDPLQSRLHLGTAEDFKPEAADKKPAIIVRTDVFTFQRLGVGANSHGATMPPPNALGQLGDKINHWGVTGTIVVFCGSNVESEAAMLADETQFMLLHLQPFALAHTGLSEFSASHLGASAQFDLFSPGTLAKPIGIRIGYTLTTRDIPESPLLRALSALTL